MPQSEKKNSRSQNKTMHKQLRLVLRKVRSIVVDSLWIFLLLVSGTFVLAFLFFLLANLISLVASMLGLVITGEAELSLYVFITVSVAASIVRNTKL